MVYLDQEFFARDTVDVARDLIGALLVVEPCEARIVETEAYTTDAASHAVTRRHAAAIMHHTYGHVYVYSIYGMHYCLNFTTERAGAGAVLIRAAEPIRGVETMIDRRGVADVHRLLRGPACICQALAIGREHHGQPVGQAIKVRPRTGKPRVASGLRIGITKAVELPWRFYEAGSSFISRPEREK